MIAGVTEITEFHTKADMSRWTRGHADSPGINWSVFPGDGGTMIVVEHEADRSTLASVPEAEPADGPARYLRCPDCEGNDVHRAGSVMSCRDCFAEWPDPKAAAGILPPDARCRPARRLAPVAGPHGVRLTQLVAGPRRRRASRQPAPHPEKRTCGSRADRRLAVPARKARVQPGDRPRGPNDGPGSSPAAIR